MSNPSINTAGELTVIELRNYVLKPGLRDRFINYFEDNFIQSQNELGANILGVYRVKGADDNFLWIRGFTDMESRSKFLPAFYYGDFWKAHRESANAMLANNDNVYLLKPLTLQNDTLVTDNSINFNQFTKNTGIAVVEFYIANTKLCKLIKLFSENYLPLIKNAGITDYSLWVSEMEENTFPQLPVFQDQNLLVTIGFYKNEEEYHEKQKQIKTNISTELNDVIMDTITTKSSIIIYPI